MFTVLLCAIFALGTIIGSFLNVVIFRSRTGFGVSTGRSMCFTCGKTLRFFDLIPVLSYLGLRGRCRYCHAHISIQYPLIETLTGVLFAVIFVTGYSLPLSIGAFALWFGFYASVCSLFVCIAVYDYYHKIIPDQFSIPLLTLSFFGLFFVTPHSAGFHVPVMLDFLAGLIIPLPVLILFLASRGRAIGFADATLFVSVGWLLGLPLGASAFILSFWIGGAVSMMLIAFTKNRIGLKSEVPFGPFIILATLIVLFTHIDVLGLSFFFDSTI